MEPGGIPGARRTGRRTGRRFSPVNPWDPTPTPQGFGPESNPICVLVRARILKVEPGLGTCELGLGDCGHHARYRHTRTGGRLGEPLFSREAPRESGN